MTLYGLNIHSIRNLEANTSGRSKVVQESFNPLNPPFNVDECGAEKHLLCQHCHLAATR